MDPRFPDPKMREEFRRELRARLMQEAPSALAPRRGTAWTSFLKRPALGVGLAGILLVAGAGTAAAGSVPGDAAFPLKKAIEDVQVNLTFDDVQRVQLLAQIADRRLQELQQVANRDEKDQTTKDTKTVTASEEFAQAISKFRAAADHVQQGADQKNDKDKSEKVQDVVDAARAKHEAVLDEVQQKVDNEKARDAIERAKDDENKDTKRDKDKRDKDPSRTERPARTLAPSRTPRPSATPRATETSRASQSPRGTQRTETPRPTGSARPSASDADRD